MLHHRSATLEDTPLLARLNRELIEDEGHENSMTAAELEARMRGWLAAEYQAVVFELEGEVVAYALYRDNEGRGVYLRQFFVSRDLRRRGIGREAFGMLRGEVLPPGTRVALDVLSGNHRAIAFWRALGFGDYALALELR
jgi:ribosomal protein S18 acetylase RimI-like enzyme